MLNKVIINTFDKLADEEGLSEVAKTNIKNYLNKIASHGEKKSSDLENDMSDIFEDLKEK